MSLQHFLGITPEIQIIDFLAENAAFAYTIEEISNYTMIHPNYLSKKLEELQFNGIITIKTIVDNIPHYHIAKNNITSALIGSVMANSFLISTYGEK
jgi:DNA-binding Lrp family transcriptional regulator